MIIDKMKLYRDNIYKVSEKIYIYQPTIGEIIDYGESRFYNMIGTLTAVGADLKWQLDDIGIDYSEISDYDLFKTFIKNIYSVEDTSIILGGLDLRNMKTFIGIDENDEILVDRLNGTSIDKITYIYMMDILRSTYGFKRNSEIPANEHTKKIFIEDAREDYNMNKNKPYKSQLLNLVSTMVNTSGFKHDEVSVFGVRIYPFMDSVKRISKIKNAELLLQSGYSGFGINLKELKGSDELNWYGELDV